MSPLDSATPRAAPWKMLAALGFLASVALVLAVVLQIRPPAFPADHGRARVVAQYPDAGTEFDCLITTLGAARSAFDELDAGFELVDVDFSPFNPPQPGEYRLRRATVRTSESSYEVREGEGAIEVKGDRKWHWAGPYECP